MKIVKHKRIISVIMLLFMVLSNTVVSASDMDNSKEDNGKWVLKKSYVTDYGKNDIKTYTYDTSGNGKGIFYNLPTISTFNYNAISKFIKEVTDNGIKLFFIYETLERKDNLPIKRRVRIGSLLESKDISIVDTRIIENKYEGDKLIQSTTYYEDSSSTTTEYMYIEKTGRRIEKQVTRVNSDGTYRIEYYEPEYPFYAEADFEQNGNFIKGTIFEEIKEHPHNYNAFEYDEDGLVYQMIREFDDSGKIMKITNKYFRTNEEWIIKDFEFDNDGNTIKHQTYNETGNLEYYTVMRWNEYGEVLQTDRFYPNGTLMREIFKKDIAYDGNKNLIMEQEYGYEGTKLIPIERNEYRYDEYGNMVERWRYDANNELTIHEINEYMFIEL